MGYLKEELLKITNRNGFTPRRIFNYFFFKKSISWNVCLVGDIGYEVSINMLGDLEISFENKTLILRDVNRVWLVNGLGVLL